jgi:hypothetical protein
LNKSDGTYGWYGNMRGLHLYYNYFTDQVEEESKSISLSPQLTPTVAFKLMKNSYLDYPYTICKPTVVEDNYYVIQHDIYKKSICEMEFFLKRVYETCGCCPNYMLNKAFNITLNGTMMSTADLKQCTFYDNVNCVSHVIDKKNRDTDEECKPACQSYEFNQDSIHYRISPSNSYGDLYYMTGVFRTSRKRVTVVEEQIVYTFNELIADIGGGLGLILGLSVIKLVELIFVATTRAKRAITKRLRIAAKKLKATFAILAWGKTINTPLKVNPAFQHDSKIFSLKNNAHRVEGTVAESKALDSKDAQIYDIPKMDNAFILNDCRTRKNCNEKTVINV